MGPQFGQPGMHPPMGQPGHGMMPAGHGPAGHGPAGPGPAIAALKALGLSDAQKAKLADLRKQYGPKLHEAVMKKLDSILTPEQRKARDEALKAAKASGKHGPELIAAVRSAVKLTDQQQQKVKAIHAEMAPLLKEIHEQVASILTPEQRAAGKGPPGVE